MASRQVEEYLEAIARLEERGQPVTTSALAEACGVAAPTATEMLSRLAEKGLVTRTPRQSATLTAAGREMASSVLRCHRLWERFLHDVLGLQWDSVHDQACELEHDTSPDLERWLAQTVESSSTCPHGHAIPGLGAADEAAALPLTALEVGQAARVCSIAREDSALLRRLGALGIRPGARVRTEETEADGTLVLTVEDVRVRAARDLAEQVLVAPVSAEDARAEEQGTVALSAMRQDEVATVEGFQGGRGIMGRCLALGFTPGAQIQMVRNTGQGPVIVLVRDTRVALGRGEAHRIRVRRGGQHGHH
jgi:DtxR family Mn-dependent transcriptional regulator